MKLTPLGCDVNEPATGAGDVASCLTAFPSLLRGKGAPHSTSPVQQEVLFLYLPSATRPNQPPQVAGYENGDDNDLPVIMDWPRANSASGSLV